MQTRATNNLTGLGRREEKSNQLPEWALMGLPLKRSQLRAPSPLEARPWSTGGRLGRGLWFDWAEAGMDACRSFGASELESRLEQDAVYRGRLCGSHA